MLKIALENGTDFKLIDFFIIKGATIEKISAQNLIEKYLNNAKSCSRFTLLEIIKLGTNPDYNLNYTKFLSIAFRKGKNDDFRWYWETIVDLIEAGGKFDYREDLDALYLYMNINSSNII